jgi:hypothetical protein
MIEIAPNNREQLILDTVAKLGGSCEYRELKSRLTPKCMAPSTLDRHLSSLVERGQLVRLPAENEGTCRCEACGILRHDLKMPRDERRRRRPIYSRALTAGEMARACEPLFRSILWPSRVLVGLPIAELAISQKETTTNDQTIHAIEATVPPERGAAEVNLWRK